MSDFYDVKSRAACPELVLSGNSIAGPHGRRETRFLLRITDEASVRVATVQAFAAMRESALVISPESVNV